MHEEGEIEGRRREVAGEEERVHRLPQLGHRREPRCGIGGEGAAQQVGERLRQRRRLAGRRGDAGFRERGEGVAPVGRPERQGRQEDEAERVHVAARVSRDAARLLGGEPGAVLGREVRRSAQRRPLAEPLQLHVAVEGDDELPRREEAVEERGARVVLLRVEVLESGGGAAHDHQRVVGREGEGLPHAALLDGGERPALDELRRDVEGLVDPPDAEDALQPGVLEAGREARLVHQALGRRGVLRDRGSVAQDRHQPVEAGGAESGGPVLASERPRLGFLEENEPSELLPKGQSIPTSRARGR